ncbi:TM2 domain-containing protein [Mucilaginibacter sp. AW1-3]
MMNNFSNPYFAFPGITPEELTLLQQATADLDEKQLHNFQMIYSTKRKNPSDVLLFCLLGLFCIAGVQRFILGQVGMGILYLFTGGLCLIGTIVDLVNHKQLANDYNRGMVYESYQMAKMSN